MPLSKKELAEIWKGLEEITGAMIDACNKAIADMNQAVDARCKEHSVDIDAVIATVLGRIPAPQDGKDGRDADPVDIDAVIDAAAKKIPAPKDGQNGRDGKDGRDAAQIEILPAIDPVKEYPRGTWASYRGGLVRAFRNTESLGAGAALEKRGWETVVNGVADIDVAMADDRTLIVRTATTDGTAREKSFTLPVMIYRGVFTPGKTYGEGDVVTWGGSAWHCNKETASSPQDKSEDWRLMVKEGRRGRDAEARHV